MKKLQWTVVVLTLLQVLTAACFCVPGYEDIISGPQHGYLDSLDEVRMGFAIDGSSQFWYSAFFINDIIWVAALLILLFNYLLQLKSISLVSQESETFYPKVFFVLGIFTFIFDVLENISYLTFDNSLISLLPLDTIVSLKVLAFSGCLLVLLIALYQKYFFNLLGVFKSSVKASIISIAGIALLFGLATFMDQGSTVIIHLFDHPGSLAGVIILLNLLALASGHYPDYINKYLERSNQHTWLMHGLFGGNSNTGLGLITYKNNPDQSGLKTEAVRQMDGIHRSFFNHFRKIIGATVMVTWLYVLFYVFQKYEASGVSPLPLTILATIMCLVLHFRSSKAKQEWRSFVQTYISPDQSVEELIDLAGKDNSGIPAIPAVITRYSNITLISFLVLLFAAGITVFSAFSFPWVTTWVLLTITTLINIVFIIQFQNFRTLIDLPLVHKHLSWVPIRKLGNDVRHVRLYALSGFITMAFYIIVTINPSATNALTIILMAIFLFYGFIVILIKHHVYYAEEGNGLLFPFAKKLFTLFVPILGVLFLVWVFFNGNVGNGLHKIPVFKESSDLIEWSSFKENLTQNPDDTKYLIASYGGGIRATAWTMLLLDSLEKSNSAFFNNTIAMSGVSGGFLGLSFYTSIRTEHENASDRSAAISSIGKHNLLSIDVSYLFGFDMIRELIPLVKKFRYRDRAGRSMATYAGLIQQDTQKKCALLYSSYRSYWAKAYKTSRAKGHHYPALIGNTTGTNSHYGVAFPIQNASFENLFPGAIDILSIGNHRDSTISFLDATSTTERFPIFSPAADIQDKGNFLDGGYFENSGLLSLMNFYEHLQKDDSLHLTDDNTKLIVLINSKEDYIRHVIGESVKAKNNKATSELGAILKTLIDISTLSLALEKKYKLRFGDNYIPVYLPYPITYDDVKKLIGGVPQDPFAVQKILTDSNQKINDVLKKYKHNKNKPIPPALARVLSDPAFDYTKAMLDHPDVQEAIKKIQAN